MEGFNTNSPFGKWLSLVAQFTAAFAAVYLGVLALGWDLMGLGLLIQNAPSFVRPLLYAVGIFGLISLAILGLHVLSGDTNSQKR